MCKTINRHFINGVWRQASNSKALYLTNPATGQESSVLMLAKQDMTEDAIAAAKSAFPAWSSTTLQQRSEYIKAIVIELKKRKNDLIDVIVEELGCPQEFTEYVQVDDPIDAFEQHVQWTLDLQPLKTIDERLVQRLEPIGVCSIITPWNYPLHQLVAKIAPALSAGCTVVVKPSELTPQCAIILAEAIEAANLPQGVFNLVIGEGREVGALLARHPDVDCVSFTGSTGVGIKIQQDASTTVKRVLLELGGKSPFIISPTKNLKAAVELGVEDVMANSGQTCVALSRMLVHESQYKQACEIAKTHAVSLCIGDPKEPSTFLGPVVNQNQFDRINAFIQLGIDEGAQLLTPTKNVQVPSAGFYVAPTIFANVTPDMTIAKEEIFGPVLVIMSYSDMDNAVAIANNSDFGLSARVWNDNTDEAISIANKIEAGQVYVNDAQWHNYAPFGGYKQSGNGRELGPDAIHEFFEIKSIIL